MSASVGRTAAFLWATAPPHDVEALLPALLDVFRSFDEKPARMWICAEGVRQYAFNERRLTAAFRSIATTSVAVTGAGEAQVDVDLYLRDDPRYDVRILDRRHVTLVARTAASDDPRLLRFLEVACGAYPVAHGGMFHAATARHSSAESSLILSSAIGADAEKRISFDSMNASTALHLLRRLYPVTIIGPAIWAALPPLPAVEPPLVVRDLADCKMVTAWPTLVDPHDLQFLLGTRELRRWLWPHTIQNPADDLATIDARLKWAELLPW